MAKKLQECWQEWAQGRKPSGPGEQFWAGGLRLASLAYGLGHEARMKLFDWHLRAQHRLPCPVFCVGNLTVGGTGKTPLVLETARILQKLGRKVAIVSRGYRRENPGRPLLVSDGENILAEGPQAGDEPRMLARALPGVIIVLCARRYEGGLLAVDQGADVVLLDDGFQHRSLARDCNIVLWDSLRPWRSAALLPRGMMREGFSALKRAQAAVFTRSNLGPSQKSLAARMKRQAPHLTLFEAPLQATGVIHWETGAEKGLEKLGQANWAAFCGIGNPDSFWKLLETEGAVVSFRKALPDHHRPRPEEMAALVQEALHSGANALICTEKDRENLPSGFTSALPLYILKAQMGLEKDTYRYERFLASHLF